MLDLNKVHTLSKPNLSEPSRLIGTNPYIRLCSGVEHVFIQSGKAYYENGTEVTKLPSWFDEAIKSCSPEALAEVGYKVKNGTRPSNSNS